MRVTLDQVSVRFGVTTVLRQVSLEVRERDLFFLLGPSGCGKTTLLRLVAGFYEPDSGEVLFGERRMNGVPPHRRNAGMVFQNYALWPHLSVADNVGYGLEVRRMGEAERRRRIGDALEMVEMGAHGDRMPNQLSGGQQQRVALARALVVQPDVLLLDEPLSNLDARLRLELRQQIRRIHEHLGLTTLYVTHDQKEALSMADQMAILNEGVVEQVGDPRTIYGRPQTRFVADFVAETNWLEAEVVSQVDRVVQMRSRWGALEGLAVGQHRVGERVVAGFRPEAVEFRVGETNSIGTVIRRVTYLGDSEQYELAGDDGWVLRAVQPNPGAGRRVGEAVPVYVPPVQLMVLARDDVAATPGTRGERITQTLREGVP